MSHSTTLLDSSCVPVAVRDGLVLCAVRDGLVLCSVRDGLVLCAVRDGLVMTTTVGAYLGLGT